MMAEDGKLEKKLGDIRRKPSSWGSISTDMVVLLGTEADGESADAVAWPFNDGSGSGLWMGRLINGRRLGDKVDTAK